MRIWIIQTGEPLDIDQGDPRPMRAMNLSKSISNQGLNVTLISSDFFHQKKIHRFGKWTDHKKLNGYRLVLIPSPGYKNHIGIKRIFDHFILGLRLNNWIKSQINKPDVIFIGYPPIEVGYFVSKWAKKNNIPYLIDVKDLWPDIFLEVFPKKTRFFGKFFLFPFYYMRNVSLKNAHAFCAMSEQYLQWMLKIAKRKKNKYDLVSGLSAPDPKKIKLIKLQDAKAWWIKEKKLNLSHKKRFVFIGSFMSVFDFSIFKEHYSRLIKYHKECEILICGMGPYKKEIQKVFIGFPNVHFIDWIDYPKMKVIASFSSGAIIPYKNIENYKINIPNKVIDALSFGLPILTTVDGAIKKMCKKHNVGYYLNKDNVNGSLEYLKLLIEDENFFNRISSNCKSLFYSHYSAELVYSRLTKNIIKLANK